LLLCDEPTGALEPSDGQYGAFTTGQYQPHLGSTVVYCHSNTVIGDMADRLIRMRSGTFAEIITNPNPLPPERICMVMSVLSRRLWRPSAKIACSFCGGLGGYDRGIDLYIHEHRLL
jgi:energy-coupling factor transporter ATP-binding protein EcfA2